MLGKNRKHTLKWSFFVFGEIWIVFLIILSHLFTTKSLILIGNSLVRMMKADILNLFILGEFTYTTFLKYSSAFSSPHLWFNISILSFKYYGYKSMFLNKKWKSEKLLFLNLKDSRARFSWPNFLSKIANYRSCTLYIIQSTPFVKLYKKNVIVVENNLKNQVNDTQKLLYEFANFIWTNFVIFSIEKIHPIPIFLFYFSHHTIWSREHVFKKTFKKEKKYFLFSKTILLIIPSTTLNFHLSLNYVLIFHLI